jgi:hypothetical protein
MAKSSRPRNIRITGVDAGQSERPGSRTQSSGCTQQAGRAQRTSKPAVCPAAEAIGAADPDVRSAAASESGSVTGRRTSAAASAELRKDPSAAAYCSVIRLAASLRGKFHCEE